MLKRHPETEVEYWVSIETLGGFIWRMNHDLADGRIKDPTGGIDKDILEARKVSEQLVEELWEKFGVVSPKNCPELTLAQRMAGQKLPPAPFGMEYYWDWYYRMKKFTHDAMYENDICSACPYSRGNNGNGIDCGLYGGMASNLTPNYIGCLMIKEMGYWAEAYTMDEFLKKLETEHGKSACNRFLVKLEALKIMTQKEGGR